jgi:lipid-binding SYLF domain-containing protein
MNYPGRNFAGVLAAATIGLLCVSIAPAKDKDTISRLSVASTVLTEAMSAPDNGIPDEMLQHAHCVVVVPGLKKGAFFVSGQYGKGFLICRKQMGWSAPAAIRIEGGGIGLQFGGSETDLVMLVMNRRGADRLMSSKFTLGADGEVAAGPIGRHASAQTDAKMTAEILSWSRSRGVFAGLALKGATLRADEDDNAELYDRKMGTKEIVDSAMAPPAAAQSLISLLTKYSPIEK